MNLKNETLINFLKNRRSTPALQLSEPIPTRSELTEMLTIASRVPDHGKLAPWRFIVYSGGERAAVGEKLAEIVKSDDNSASPERLSLESSRFTRAPLVVGVISCAAIHPKVPEWEQVMSAGASCFNLVVAANAFGYGAVWLTEWYAFDARAYPVLGVEPGEKVVGFVHIGTRTEDPFDRPRPDLKDIVTWRGDL